MSKYKYMKVTLRLFVLLTLGSLLSASSVKADEGMWLPYLINKAAYADMQKNGLKLTPEEIYSANHSSLKDAIVLFGRGCTGEVISDQGLILTNHHCGFGSIQSVSTVGKDYLFDGFWAQSLKEEIPITGLTVRFLVRFEDVTMKILGNVGANASEKVRKEIIEDNKRRVTSQATDGTSYDAVVKEFYDGNEYYLFVYQTYKDIRLVGTPPQSIGKFGADTDNWMWPRHTGDFSMFRVYVGKDNKPAPYSKDNVPLKPAHYLPINASGVKEGDFTMIMGFPGTTNRYMTSWGVNQAIEETNPSIVSIRRKKLDIMGEDMANDPAVRIKYASKYASTANYWKYFIGQTRGLQRLNVAEKKHQLETRFADWANQNETRKERYGNTLPLFDSAFTAKKATAKTMVYYSEAFFRGAETPGFAFSFSDLISKIQKSEKTKDPFLAKQAMKEMQASADAFFKDFNVNTDKKLLAAMFEMFYKEVPQDQQPEWLISMAKKYNNNFYELAEYIISESIFANPEKVKKLLDKPKVKKIEEDPAFVCYKAFSDKYAQLKEASAKGDGQLVKAKRLFADGLRQFQSERQFYPDANQTMRLTWGTVGGYNPADAKRYNYFTTYQGILDKEDPTNPEFVVPAKLKELLLNKDFGRWADNGTLKVCYIHNTDITGGNSGSPVMNGKGELIGLAFDGNWEAMSGDIAFEPSYQRTISVDIRYVLFIIDKFAGAERLIKEMKIVE